MLTTRELIVMAAWYLFDRPDLRARFTAGDDEAQFAIIDEILRLEPTVAVVAREVVEDIDTPACGHIPAGTLVAVDIRAANLDEAAIGACPHAVDPARPESFGSGYMSFGDGPHRCPGAQLSLHEVRLFLDRLFAVSGLQLERAPRLDWFRPVYSYELHDAVISCDP
jgi:cytochrome P450